MLLQAVACPRPKLIGSPAAPGDPNHGHVEAATSYHRLQRRENFLVSQVTRGAEEDQGIRGCWVHGQCLSHGYWPAAINACFLTSSSTALGDPSKTAHWWPALTSCRTKLAPIRPRPIMPSCILNSFIRTVCSTR